MALIPVPDDHVACVVTTLEMAARPMPRPMPPSPLRLVRWAAPAPEKYRMLFRRVGAPWLWYSRLVMDDARLAAILGDPGVGVHAVVDRAGIEIGMLELDHRAADACEIAYLGLVPEQCGRGHGRWLMAQALALAWTRAVRRVTVRTCTLDHPHALGFYRAQGFAAVSRTLETFPDPRVAGILPDDAAPQVPRLASRA